MLVEVVAIVLVLVASASRYSASYKDKFDYRVVNFVTHNNEIHTLTQTHTHTNFYMVHNLCAELEIEQTAYGTRTYLTIIHKTRGNHHQHH